IWLIIKSTDKFLAEGGKMMIEQRLVEALKWKEFVLPYQFAMDHLTVMLEHMNLEATHLRNNNPVEHVKTRLKSPESILSKMKRKGYPVSLESVAHHVYDVVGVRIICSFVSDIYELVHMLSNRKDIKIKEC